jgi:hypothetical protein
VSAAELLATLGARDVRVAATAGRLRIDAPAGALTAADRQALLRHKPALLALLARQSGPNARADEFADLRRRLATGELRGYGELRLADGTLVFDVAGYARENLDRLSWPPLAADAARHLRLLRETLGAIDRVDAQA